MLPCGTLSDEYRQDMAIIRTRLQWGMFVVLLLAVFVVPPLFANTTILDFIIRCCIFIIAVNGLNIVTGLCGQISLGQAAFMAVGGYIAALLATHGVPWLGALLAAVALTGILGLLFGIPSLKVKGLYLLVATLAAHFIIMWVIEHGASPWTNGFEGISVPCFQVGGFVFDSMQSLCPVVVAFTIVAIYFAKNMARTKSGRAFIAIRDNDLAADVTGINIFRYKVLAFTISAMYAGLAGALLGAFYWRLNPDFFTIMDAIWMLGMLIIGGFGSTVGAIAGVIFFKGLEQMVWMSGPTLFALAPAIGAGAISALTHVLFGVVIILFLVFEPRGINHRWEILKASYRIHPFAY